MSYDDVPEHIKQATEAFADRLKEVSDQGRWPQELEAQTTLILRVITQSDADASLDEFTALEELFKSSRNPEFVELPEGHTRRDRAHRMALCMQASLDAVNARKQTGYSRDEEILRNSGSPESPYELRDPERQRIRTTQPMIGAVDHVCPRCGEGVPTNERRGEYKGARSRTDHLTEVCSPCGSEESWQEMDGSLIAQSAWPISRTVTAPSFENFTKTWEEYRSTHRRVIAPPPLPRELPDLRLHLMEKWIPGGPYEKALAIRGMESAHLGANAEREALRMASLWWIKDEMVRLTIAAAKSIPDDIRGEEIKLPDDQAYGLAVLGGSWVGTDALDEGQPVQVNAMGWAPTRIDGIDCISLSMYRYFDFAAGLGPRDLQEAIATGAVWDAAQEHVGNGPVDERQIRLRGGSWVFMGRSDWPLKETLSGFEIISAEVPSGQAFDGTHKSSMMEDRRFFAAFCTLVNHKLSQVEMEWAPRVVRKRSEKAGVDTDKEPCHVRMIRLREVRKQYIGDEDREKRHVEWTHRWIVNGHMAWRRCGPKGENRRLVFIAPHTKGPEDKPLVIKDDVRVWTR